MTQDQPLMPKATASWLIDNTTLAFDQIAAFCGLHALEVQAVADGAEAGLKNRDPVAAGELTRAEIDRCEADPAARLALSRSDLPEVSARSKGPRYTPVSKRADKPDGIAWLLKNEPDLADAQIARLVGTTKPTIQAVRDKSHWNAQNIRARNPVLLGLCTEEDLNAERARARSSGRSGAKAAVEYPSGEDIHVGEP